MGEQQQALEIVFRSRRKKPCLEHALVLEAANIRFVVQRRDSEFVVLVAERDAGRALGELAAYVRENRGSEREPLSLPHHAGVWVGVYGFVAVLLLVDICEDRSLFGMNWSAAGRTDAELILQGQWWRSITALSLHADAAHLVGNVVVGGLFGLLAAQLLGSGLAWLSILICGAAGNGLNAWIRQTQHTSIGASTAVFAALGIVMAYLWIRRRQFQSSRLTRWAPLICGVVLLGYFGAGGARTDVTAHLTGFCSGLALGAGFGRLGDRVRFGSSAQFWLGSAALTLLVLSWALALLDSAAGK